MKIKKLYKSISIVLMAFISLLTPSCTEDFDVLYELEDFGKNVTPLSLSIANGEISYTMAEIELTLNRIPLSGGYTMGICYDINTNPKVGNDFVSITNVYNTTVNTTIENLNPSTVYYARAFYNTNGDIVYSNEITFSTINEWPAIELDTITNITISNANIAYTISTDGGTYVKERGICWSTSPNPSIIDNKTIDGTGIGSYNTIMNSLSASTIYYVRSYATNDKGTQYSNEKSFITRNE